MKELYEKNIKYALHNFVYYLQSIGEFHSWSQRGILCCKHPVMRQWIKKWIQAGLNHVFSHVCSRLMASGFSGTYVSPAFPESYPEFPALMTSESSTALKSRHSSDVFSHLDFLPNVWSTMWASPPGAVICFPELKCKSSSNNKVLWMKASTKLYYFCGTMRSSWIVSTKYCLDWVHIHPQSIWI